jgi:DNA mismatch repair ATPase MutS
MTTYKHLLWLAPAVLVIAVIVIVRIDTPIMSSLPTTEISQPDPKSNQNVKQVEIRNEENSGLKNQQLKQIEVQNEEQSGLKNQAIKHVEVRKEDQEIKQIEIRKQEEQRLKKQDKFYAQQAKAQAERYENMADIVARNGGDPKPLLDAAAYFENESK